MKGGPVGDRDKLSNLGGLVLVLASMKGGPVGDRDEIGPAQPQWRGQASMKGGPVGDRDRLGCRRPRPARCLNEGRSRWGPRPPRLPAAKAGPMPQ